MANRCTNSEAFYNKLEELKANAKTKSSLVEVYIEDSFYQKAYQWLKAKAEGESNSIVIERKDKRRILAKKWRVTTDDGKILDAQNRSVVPKKKLYTVLNSSHSAIAHRGRDKMEEYVRKRYSDITQKVINLFISLCSLHQQQKSVTDHQKKPINHPIQADGFMNHVQIDSVDFRSLPCQCKGKPHTWLLHVSDHFTKYSWLIPLTGKQSTQVVAELKKLFYMFGFPKKLHSDNGGEFKNKNMKNLCETHNIKLVHGAPRNPSTQGQVERNNSTVKVNITNVLKEKYLQPSHWCEVEHEAAYKKNISLHRAIRKTPYYVVFGKEHNKECHDAKTNDQVPEENSTMEDQSTGAEQMELENERQTNGASYRDCTMEHESTGAEQVELVNDRNSKEAPESRKRKQTTQSVIDSQTNYNKKMKLSRNKQRSFKVEDYVTIKIDKFDKTTPLHPSVLLGKIINMENDYAKVVTTFGIISTYISTSRLNKCTRTNVLFDYTKEIPFSTASKQAINQ